MKEKKTPAKKRPTKAAVMGRPLKVIDWDYIARCCHIQCTQEELKHLTGMDDETIKDACLRDLGITFSQFYKEKAEAGKKSLRRAQWKVACETENPTMLIWLGKQHLNQSEKSESKVDLNMNMIGEFKINLVDK